MKKYLAAAAAVIFLTGCGQSAENDMQYIKTSVMYDTLTDMYQNPEQYLGKLYHMSGQFYPSESDDGTKIYSVYTEGSDGHGIGLELDWSDYSGLNERDMITVEGKLDKEEFEHDGEKSEFLILRVTSLEKRDKSE